MKILLKSVSNAGATIDVNEDDTVESISSKLVELMHIPLDHNIKLVYMGNILDFTQKISHYGIKDGSQVIYFHTKKKENKPVAHVQPQSQQPQNDVLQTASSIGNNNDNEYSNDDDEDEDEDEDEGNPALPSTFNGVDINIFRQFAIMNVLGRVISSPQIFSTILLQDPQIQLLHNNNPDEFDSIIFHPDFLPGELGNVTGSISINDSNMHNMHDMHEPSLENNDNDSQNHVGQQDQISIQALGPQALGPSNRIILSKDDKDFIDEVKLIVPDVTDQEIIQIYLACDKNKEATVNALLNNKYSN